MHGSINKQSLQMLFRVLDIHRVPGVMLAAITMFTNSYEVDTSVMWSERIDPAASSPPAAVAE